MNKDDPLAITDDEVRNKQIMKMLYEVYIDMKAIELGGPMNKIMVRNIIKVKKVFPSLESIKKFEISFN